MSTGYYQNIWIIAVPTTEDTVSQKYRFVWVQGQTEHANDTLANAETTNNLNIGTLGFLTTEFVFIGRVTIRYIGGNWSITQVKKLKGTRNYQTIS